jgi:hypothetical protein
MGCDIHAHFEVKINGEWIHYSEPRIDRSYTLFAKIANVRNCSKSEKGYIEPITNNKGLPCNISIITKIHYKHWESDAHSTTWLDAKEIKEMMDYIKKIPDEAFSIEHTEIGYLFGNGWGSFLKYREDYPEEVEDIRFICWFDN